LFEKPTTDAKIKGRRREERTAHWICV